ncbi:MAG: methyltransferase domain-containing protein [Bdellovibrionales bacterium]
MTGGYSPFVFDRSLVRQHIARAKPRFLKHSVLFDDTAAQLEERLDEIKQPFRCALDISPFPFLEKRKENVFSVQTPKTTANEELLPFAPQSFDLIVSNLGLHWVNDLPGALIQCCLTLKPKGLFLAALIGGQSLRELRQCLLDAEISVSEGISPRFSPMIDLQTAASLMKRAGFLLPVADIETITLLYADMFALMRDLRGMGQTNAHVERLRQPTRRSFFLKASELYQDRFGNAEGLIPATFDIIYLHGWK